MGHGEFAQVQALGRYSSRSRADGVVVWLRAYHCDRKKVFVQTDHIFHAEHI